MNLLKTIAGLLLIAFFILIPFTLGMVAVVALSVAVGSLLSACWTLRSLRHLL